MTVTRHGKPIMAILPWELYKALLELIDSLQETLEVLEDAELMAAFRQGVNETSRRER